MTKRWMEISITPSASYLFFKVSWNKVGIKRQILAFLDLMIMFECGIFPGCNANLALLPVVW